MAKDKTKTRELVETLFALVERFTLAYNEFKQGCKISTEYNSGKEYWSIELMVKYCNATYTDCIIIYDNDTFDMQVILDEWDEMYETAKKIVPIK
jgi:hypothetical protein